MVEKFGPSIKYVSFGEGGRGVKNWLDFADGLVKKNSDIGLGGR